MAEGDGGNFGQTETAKSAAASETDSRQTNTLLRKYTPITLPDTNNSYFYNDDDRTPPKESRGWKKSRHTMTSDKGEANKKSKEDFVLKPAPVTVAKKN